MPSIAHPPKLPAKPPISAAASGTSVNATSTDVIRKRINSSSAATVPIPSSVSIPGLRFRPTDGVGFPPHFVGVLSERRRRHEGQCRDTRELDWISRNLHRSNGGGRIDQHLACRELRIREHLTDGANPAARHTRSRELLDQRVDGLLPEEI